MRRPTDLGKRLQILSRDTFLNLMGLKKSTKDFNRSQKVETPTWSVCED
ncbi:hypothetical protein Goshw_013280 [Gossypium schwendimanii]|uniref:Uncharacterized protein n=1 Tax=Gossypium schwendimanii TaxID=34291 RepID=A0A7J9MN89_GOSSC|nr:hypothetical protein [Gossypium schwendimanii]